MKQNFAFTCAGENGCIRGTAVLTAWVLGLASRLQQQPPHPSPPRILLTSVATEINKKGIDQWQQQWNNTVKGAVCRSLFPRLEPRLNEDANNT